jgi:hypothetical protein
MLILLLFLSLLVLNSQSLEINADACVKKYLQVCFGWLAETSREENGILVA